MTTYTIPMAKPSLTPVESRRAIDCLIKGWITMGPVVHKFEEEFAQKLGVKHAIATSSGTAALHLALLAAGVKPGDRVLVPTLTYVATVAAIRYCGAVPVFGDSDPETWGLNVPEVRGWRLPVHLYGVMAEGARNDGSTIIEDAAEALGAHGPTGRPAGTYGLCGVFSFYGNKILTTGEGGMVVSDDDGLAEEVRLLRGQGQDPSRRYWHTRVGYNYRMTDLQAALGLGQLERLDEMLAIRRTLVERYLQNLYFEIGDERIGIQTPRPGTRPAPWVFACLLKTPSHRVAPDAFRDWVSLRLAQHGIETRPTFPCVHQMPPYREFATQQLGTLPVHYHYGGTRVEMSAVETQSFPIAEDISSRGLLLPLFAEMTMDQVDEVCHRLLELL